MFCISKCNIPILISSGILSAFIGTLMFFLFPVFMDMEIRKRLVLKPGTESFKNWKDIPVPIYLHIYFFHVNNTEEVFNLTNKPSLIQMGPYTFREEREKVNLSINANGTITYKQIKKWYFEPNKTVGSLDDIVTTLNVPMMSAAAKAKQINSTVIYFAIQEAFVYYNSSWFVRKKVRELIFEGYKDPIMEFAEKFVNLPYDKFGWFYKRNGTDDGEFNIFSGNEDLENVDGIHTWNGKKTVSAFQPPCNMINGTAGDVWPPISSTNINVTMFVPDICRSITFNFLHEVYLKGVRVYRYFADKYQLDNGQYDSKNKCFCTDGTCLPAGAVSVSVCKFDAPAVVSYPHFLYADTVYRDGVTGMNPEAEKHRMFLDIVPEMGVPLQVGARMQINIIFEPISKIKQFKNITRKIYFPVLWFSETAVTGDHISAQLRLVLNTMPIISKVISFTSIVVGVILVTVAVLFCFRQDKWQRIPPPPDDITEE